LNLGLEGFMLMGAVSTYGGSILTGEKSVGILAALLVSGGLGFVFALLTVRLRANQVVCGLAMVILCTGLSSLVGYPLIGLPFPGELSPTLSVPGFSRIPWLGRVVFSQDLITYISLLLVPLLWFFLWQTRPGLHLRSVGENPAAADTLGINVLRTRFISIMLGCALAGLGGAALALNFSPSWTDNVTAGRGWIALAVVVFSGWKPLWAMIGALMFGSVQILGFRIQALGIDFPAYLTSMLPYFLPIVVMVMAALKRKGRNVDMPAALGRPYMRESS
jgi:simple sugar transport system permease protein